MLINEYLEFIKISSSLHHKKNSLLTDLCIRLLVCLWLGQREAFK